ncbi:MAG: WD40 repeat domain-containing protein [Ekhidna sp.]|nr:WD40 repeat domain-containing protein [Ekhidna sp.]
MTNISIKKHNSYLGHTDSIYTLEQVSDNEFLSAGADGMVILWNLENPGEGKLIVKAPRSIYSLKYDEEEQFLYVGQNGQGIHKIDFNKKKEVGLINFGQHQLFDIEVIDDKLWVALAAGELVVLSKDLQVLSRKKYSSDRIRNIQVFDNQIAVSSSDRKIRKINPETFEVTQELTSHKNSVFASKYHPSGKYLASVGRDAHIKVWDVNTNYTLRESIAAHLHTINDLVFRPDGRYFATGSMDKSIKLWDAHNFKLLKVLDKQRHEGHGNSVNALLWMRYNNLLVSCSDDRSISVWEIHFDE